MSERTEEPSVIGMPNLSIDESDGRLERLLWSGRELEKLHSLSVEAGLPLMSLCLSAHRRFPLGSRDAEVRAAALDRGAGSIVAVHLKDTLAVGRDFPGQFRSVPFGSGCVDFKSCFARLEAAGYAGFRFLTVDLEHTYYGPEKTVEMVRAGEAADLCVLACATPS